jgi:hypothetical protein
MMASTNLTTLATTFVVGAGLAALVTYGIIGSGGSEPPPCLEPPGDYHTVIIALDQSAEPPVLTVNPMELKGVQQCDVVSFVNQTGYDAKIDFSPTGGQNGTPFNESEVFPISSGTVETPVVKSPQVVVEAPVATSIGYDYTVTIEGYQQSPVIRVGPRK